MFGKNVNTFESFNVTSLVYLERIFRTLNENQAENFEERVMKRRRRS
jgi:hypothetical protein